MKKMRKWPHAKEMFSFQENNQVVSTVLPRSVPNNSTVGVEHAGEMACRRLQLARVEARMYSVDGGRAFNSLFACKKMALSCAYHFL